MKKISLILFFIIIYILTCLFFGKKTSAYLDVHSFEIDTTDAICLYPTGLPVYKISSNKNKNDFLEYLIDRKCLSRKKSQNQFIYLYEAKPFSSFSDSPVYFLISSSLQLKDWGERNPEEEKILWKFISTELRSGGMNSGERIYLLCVKLLNSNKKLNEIIESLPSN